MVIPLSLKKEEGMALLEAVTKNFESYDKIVEERYKPEPLVKFNGYLKGEEFKVSKKIGYPQNFLPQVTGNIEDTSSGCLVFLSFQLFPGTKFLFWLWFIVSLSIAILFLFKGNYFAFSVAIFLFLFNHIVTVSNFNLHYKDTLKTFYDVFDV